MIFLEKCSLLVDRLGHTSECYIEVQQKRGRGIPDPLGSPLAMLLLYVFGKFTQVKPIICNVKPGGGPKVILHI